MVIDTNKQEQVDSSKSILTKPLTLRDYQQDAVTSILDTINNGYRRIGVVIATGGGKTVVFSHLIPLLKPFTPQRGNKVLVLVHTQELVAQATHKIRSINSDLNVQVEMRNQYASPEADVVVASVHSLARGDRLNRFTAGDFKAIIVDECHHAIASTWMKIFKYFNADSADSEVYVIGFTATFKRGDNAALSSVFDKIAYERTLETMIKNRELSDIDVSTIVIKQDLSKLKVSRGDYDTRELSIAMRSHENIKRLAAGYLELQKLSKVKRTLIFCVDIQHCVDVCDHLQGLKINAQYVTGETNKIDRDLIVDDFNDGKVEVLCNVRVFTEGTDIPAIDSIILARPTMSETLKFQMVGRGLRLHKDKTRCHVVDLCGVTKNGMTMKSSLGGGVKDETVKQSTAEKREEVKPIRFDVPSGYEDQMRNYFSKNNMQFDTRRGIVNINKQPPDEIFKNHEAVREFLRITGGYWMRLDSSTWGVPLNGMKCCLIQISTPSGDGQPIFRMSVYYTKHQKNKSEEKKKQDGGCTFELIERLGTAPNLATVYNTYAVSKYAPKKGVRTSKYHRKLTEAQVSYIMGLNREFIEAFAKKIKFNVTVVENYFKREVEAMKLFKGEYFLVSLIYSVSSLYASQRRNEIFQAFEKLNIHYEVGKHTNNWAVLVSTSRFWFNYRHMANVLSLYRTVKRMGIPDSQIILMLSDDIACNSRNAFPGTVFNNMDQAIDLYGESIEVDYRGYEVTVENFIRLLTDRWDDTQPRSKRLLTDENSNIFIYLTGHGGNEFLKFQDAEEIGAYDIADTFAQMYEKKRYNEIFFMIDTCQANTMYEKIYSPNILAVGSSAFDESSYSHHSDLDIGVAVIDRFTYYTLDFLENIPKDSKITMDKLFEVYTYENVHSHPGIRTDLFKRNISEVLLSDFFGNVQKVIVDNVESDLLSIVSSNTTQGGSDTVKRDIKRGSKEFSYENQDNYSFLPGLSSDLQAQVLGGATVVVILGLWLVSPQI
ncbi:GPI-anchor transamidase [Spathaspora sp. JA1]|nr:GPI-anchor transamidase [Spathaspora sp. JA1]